MARNSNRQQPKRVEIAVVTVLLVLFSGGGFALQYSRARAMEPTTAERIYATLTEWGVNTVGITPPTDASEIDRRIEQLRSDMSEQRVEAARWLASRGISEAGDEIVACLSDTRTLRPCQLAHSLGKLGGDRWAGELLAAANQTDNRDLQSCAAIGLTYLASSRAVQGLIDVTRDDPSRMFAIEALGEIGDPRALDHLRRLRERAMSPSQRRTITTAIERIGTLSQPDPIPDLLSRVTRSAQDQRIDTWALRHIARIADGRSVATLARLFKAPAISRDSRDKLAAALLSHGTDGLAALRQARSRDSVYEVAAAAESLVQSDSPL